MLRGFLFFFFCLFSPLLAKGTEWYPIDISTVPHRPHEEFVCITLPKSGTHLLNNTLTLMTRKQYHWPKPQHFPEAVPHKLADNPHYKGLTVGKCRYLLGFLHNQGLFFLTHLTYSNALDTAILERRAKIILNVRDPRDVCISLVDYMKKKFRKEWPSYFLPEGESAPRWFSLSEEEQITYTLIHIVTPWIRKILDWRDNPNHLLTKYEDLVGERGGGSKEAQVRTLQAIADHIGIALSDEELTEIAAKAYGIGGTFYKGKIERWKNRFTEEQKELTTALLGDILEELGYNQ